LRTEHEDTTPDIAAMSDDELKPALAEEERS
jgi:hypothetical protein